MNTLQQILAISATGVSFIVGLLTFLIKSVKNGKAKKFLQNTLKITDVLQPLIITAEQFLHFSGAEKKEYVLTKANQYALDNCIKFDRDKVSELINELVSTTKKVNARSKDIATNTVQKPIAPLNKTTI